MARFESAFSTKMVYVYRIPDKAHEGCLKVGETTVKCGNLWELAPNSSILNAAAEKRIKEQTLTAGIKAERLYTELLVYVDKKGTLKSVNDGEVRNVLYRSGIKKKVFDVDGNPNEWVISDLETVKNAIKAAKEGRASLTGAEISKEKTPISFRPEQEDAIKKTLKRFKTGKRMLWYAKMRFGKTLSALQVVKQMGFRRTIIITHRPVVDSGWFEDFDKIFYDSPEYAYGSKNNGELFANLESNAKKGTGKYVYFASIQDLRGSEEVGGKFDKNNDIFSTKWDLVIIDEAHEGTQTELGKNVHNALVKDETKVLHLSGTPFNLLDDFDEAETYTWDYVMEQKAKANWELIHCGEPNPYASLPKLNIYTYDLGKLYSAFKDDGGAFNFREFFRTNDEGNFKHESDVASFLNLLCKEGIESEYPYSTKEFRDNFRHSLWMVTGVKEAKALSSMLQNHPVFSSFQIVNVAGDGDEEANYNDALKAVKDAIGDNPDETYTITLSCGKLTTGVSVPAWTAVFMLSGSYSTAAAGYMQTIFRVQTPATINGRVKEECFVFDFAPDRTLKVIAETAKFSIKGGKGNSDSDRQKMGEFLNFCPIISMEGSKMKPYDVPHLLEQLKRVYIERVVSRGFEDIYLYDNDALMQLDELALKDFEDLKGKIGSTKANHSTGEIDLNNQGFSNEEHEQLEQAEKKQKQKKELTPEEKRLLEEKKEKNKNRLSAISILRGISIRMPLLIYGADIKDEDEINLDNFVNIVDDLSWEEFMPYGVTKADFENFKKYYDKEVFAASGRRIREMVKAADDKPIEERIERIASIFGSFRNPDKETVLTPWRVVNMHLSSAIGGWDFFDENYEHHSSEPRFVSQGAITEEVFDVNSKILEINSKSGLYPLYVTYSIFRNKLQEIARLERVISDEDRFNIWDDTVANNIYVVCKTPMAKNITKRTLLGFREGRANTKYFDDLINQIKSKPENFISKVTRFNKKNEGTNMKFNAVVGNPPYQLTKEGTSDAPVYHLFMDISYRLSDIATFITPARFLFNAGKTPKEWNQKILNDNHFNVVWYKPQSLDVFPNVDIKGGVAVTIRNQKVDYGKIGTFSTHPEIREILKKVVTVGFISLKELIYAPESYRISKQFHVENPECGSALGQGHLYDVTTNIFDKIPSVFYDTKPLDGQEYVRIYGRANNERVCKWILKRYIDSHANLDTYKVILPKSNGSGLFGETLSLPIVGEPQMGHSQTFISIGCFATNFEAEACLKYLKSKFVRALLGTLKVTQDNKKESWSNVPMQDFTSMSDINWAVSIKEIDAQLYAKYGFSETEISFVENKVSPM